MHEELKLAPAAPVTLRRDVGHYLVYYLQENQERFPGVEVQRVFVRAYPTERSPPTSSATSARSPKKS